MKEIGSEFYINNIKNKKYQNNFWNFGLDQKFVFSGRTALDYILKNIKSSQKKLTIYLPSYICESVINTIKKNNIEIEFYNIDIKNNEFMYDIDLNKKIDIFFGISYFGLSNDKIDTYISQFSKKNVIVIEDITHRLLSNKNYNKESDYLICSLRKWFPIISGGIAVSVKKKFNNNFELQPPSKKYIILKKAAMIIKKIYIEKFSIIFLKNTYLKLYKKSQKIMDINYELKKIDKYSLNYIKTVNINKIKEKRKENCKYILENLNNKNIHPIGKLKKNICPLFLPCIVSNKQIFQQELIKKNIFFPSHWPISNENKNFKNILFTNEISIVCDQRYNIEELNKMILYLNNIESELKNANNNK